MILHLACVLLMQTKLIHGINHICIELSRNLGVYYFKFKVWNTSILFDLIFFLFLPQIANGIALQHLQYPGTNFYLPLQEFEWLLEPNIYST